MRSVEPDVYEFGGFELDTRAVELRREGRALRIFPRAFDLLLYLIRQRERVVSREELLEALWPGITVTNAVLTQTVWELRKVLSEAGDGSPELIRNARGRGYRFVGELASSAFVHEPEAVVPREAGTSSQPAAHVAAQAQSYVGREVEIARLSVALDAARDGRGSAYLLGGEPGIGKTRAAEEIMALARKRGMTVFEGRWYESEGGPPFWPWLQLVRCIVEESTPKALREFMGTGAPDLCRFCPELRAIAPDVPEPPARPVEQDRFYLLDSVANFLVRASGARPIAFSIDDLQWADRASLLLLEVLARMLPRARMLIIGTYRTTELSEPQPFARSLVALSRCCECITLSGLSEADVSSLLSGEVQAIDAKLVKHVYEITGGNPLFVIHIARLLPATEPGRAALLPAQLALPDEVREVLGRRIAQLPSSCVDLLRWAAAFGQRFRVCELARATERDHDELLGVLQSAADARIVCEDQLGVYRFTHPLIREALHQSVRMPERARLHQRIGEIIEARGGNGDSSRYEELAYHFCEAATIGSAEKAVDYAERAASRALAATAHEAAVEYFEKALHALELMTPLDLPRAAELRLQLGQALRAAREDPVRTRNMFLGVAEIGKTRNDAALFARAALGYAGLSPLRFRDTRDAGTVDPTEVSLLEQALVLLPEGDCTLRALALGQLAVALYNTRERKRREHLASAAVEMARRLAEPNTLAQVMLLQHRVITAPDQLDERLALTSEILSLTQVMELRELELDAHVQRAFLFLQKGQLLEAEADMAASVRLAEELQQPDEKDWARRFGTLRLFWEGRFDEAERESQQMVDKYAFRGIQNPDQGHLIRVFTARWLQGRSAETIGMLVALADKYPLPVVWRCSIAATYACIGQPDLARRELDRLAVHDFEDLPYDHNWLSCYMHLGTVCYRIDDRERAPLVYRALEPFGDRMIFLGHAAAYSGPIAHPLAALATTLGRFEQAESWFIRALESNARFGATVWTPPVQVDYADMLLRRGSQADRRKAHALLEAATATAREYGLGEVMQRATRMLAGSRAGAAGHGAGAEAILTKS
jgi:DNA-binding winged helix-turn-helix (wHTH) protein/tetratricopeptide (TPR) repeat protein